MMDDSEEFEPLFDYSRVQPLNNLVCLDDDEDVICAAAKKRKNSRQPAENEKKEINMKGVEVVDIDDDDWLPPPPKVISKAPKHPTADDDSTLKKLRLKKQELVSFAEEAKDLLKTVEEAARMEISNSLQSSTDSVSEKTSKQPDRTKILISVQDKDGTKQIRMFMDDTFERIVKTYAEKIKCDLKQVVLSFDGEKISVSQTPASLGMEDDDMIEVHVKSS